MSTSQKNILLVEDDLTLAYFVRRKLGQANYKVDVINNGRIAREQSISSDYHLVILDIVLPDISGIQILKRIRERGLKTPVIIITDSENELKEIESYESGASLFHSKPLDFKLLEAQIKSLVSLEAAPPEIKIGDLYLEPGKHLLLKDGEPIELTFKEYKLLLALIDATGGVLTRQEILNLTYKGVKESEEGSVDTLVSRMRKKLGDYKGKSVVETVHGRGFRLNLSYTSTLS